MKKCLRTVAKREKVNEQDLSSFLVKKGQGLPSLVDLIEPCQVACNELIDVAGRAAIQAVLQLVALRRSEVRRGRVSGAPET